jgi:hypothetical protein
MTQSLNHRAPKKTHLRELEIGLPGEHLTDPDLVGRAIEDLNRIHLDCALDYCLRIGDYILDSFFDGEIGQFDRRAKRHRTFRSLAESGKLTFSTSYLWTSVAVACQYRELPPRVAQKLPLSHHRLLLSRPRWRSA